MKLTPKVWLLIILVATAFCYSNSLNNDFLPGMDDDMYILDNLLVKTLNLSEHFKFDSFVAGNYHPLTTLSYAAEYSLFGEKAFNFHLTNLLLHLLNTALVFVFINLLLKNETTSLLAAAIFALHPMHVESVSWISERKDQLYMIFYLSALISYLKYFKSSEIKGLGICLGFFLLSLLSKPMAVTFPLILMLIDWYFSKNITIKTLLQKVPFFALSIAFGLIALRSQASGNTYNDLILNYSLYDKLSIICYGPIFYIFKFLIPINLSIYHFYPNSVGVVEMISPLLLIGMGILLLKYRNTEIGKVAILGLGLFIISLLPVAQIKPVGRAFVAERYTYFAYLGLSLPLLWWAKEWLQNPKFKMPTSIAIVVVFCGFGYLTFERNKVWASSETLFTDLVQKYPDNGFGYYSRGVVYDESSRLDQALSDYNRSIELNPKFYKSFNNRAAVRGKKGDLQGALEDATNAIQLNPGFASAYNNQGNAYSGLGKFEKAIESCSKAIEKDPNFSDAFNNRASAYLTTLQYDKALSDFQKLNKLKPNSAEALQGIAASYQGLKEYEKSVDYFSRSLSVSPKNYIGLFGRAASYFYLEKFNEAIADYDATLQLNPSYTDAWVNRGMSYFKLNDIKKACESWIKAQELGAKNVGSFITNYCQ